jgi:hypothetical protein
MLTVIVQLQQSKSAMSVFPSLEYFIQCHVARTHADVFVDPTELIDTICSETVPSEDTHSHFAGEMKHQLQLVCCFGLLKNSGAHAFGLYFGLKMGLYDHSYNS